MTRAKSARNERALVNMPPEAIVEFLDGRRAMTASTIGADGYIHSVAMWYAVLDGRVALLAKRKSQKAVNALRDGRITCLVEDGESYAELRGVCLVGQARVEDDQAALERVAHAIFDRYGGEGAVFDVAASTRNRVVIWVEPRRVVSWDHRRLTPPERRRPVKRRD
jgi:PPOX class probable F420-dependent enzyme